MVFIYRYVTWMAVVLTLFELMDAGLCIMRQEEFRSVWAPGNLCLKCAGSTGHLYFFTRLSSSRRGKRTVRRCTWAGAGPRATACPVCAIEPLVILGPAECRDTSVNKTAKYCRIEQGDVSASFKPCNFCWGWLNVALKWMRVVAQLNC